ncbi:MAG: ornithine--oxo-acid transaminase [Sphaerospermopsis sp. SIO1G2]|nr:ornithine--oxo-acid transaminase [Sphaerospermopsis sp. SIO1G2]
MISQDFIDLEQTYAAHTYKPIDVVIERGDGVWVHDVEGKKYLDCLSAYSAVNQGHCHPRIQQAMIDQLGRVTLTSRAFRNNQLGPFLQKLSQLTSYDKAIPMNSGAEAVETAVKAARKWGHVVKGVPENTAEIIVCEGNFHGRTTTIVSFSSDAQYKENFGPLTPGFTIIPYGDAQALENAITDRTVAFLFEPIQGEGGVIVPPSGYIKKVREICDQHNVLMIADEIQTGFGRTGKLFACDHEEVRPDIVTIGKALSGGFYPVSAAIADDRILGLFRPGDHGSTFGGNPLGAVVASTAIDVLVEENLVQQSQDLGEYFMGRLRRIESAVIKEVRGKGLLIGVELTENARPYAEALRDRGVLAKETKATVIRFAPPLVITKEEIDWAIEQIEAVFNR